MSEQLRQAFEGMLCDEPPVRVDVDDIVDAGRQRLRQRHRRRRQAGLLAAAAVLVVAVAGVLTWISRDDGDPTVEMSPAATTTAPPQATTSSVPAGPEETSSTSAATTTTTVTNTTVGGPTPGDATGPGSGTGGPSGELLADPGFEESPIAWQAFGPARLVPSQDARTGGQALAVEANTLDPVAIGATSSPAGGVVAGTAYQASCWVRSGSDTGARVQLQEQATGTPAGDPTVSGATQLGDPTGWSQVTVTHVATGSGDGLALTVYADELTPGTPPLLIDDCSLTATP